MRTHINIIFWTFQIKNDDFMLRFFNTFTIYCFLWVFFKKISFIIEWVEFCLFLVKKNENKLNLCYKKYVFLVKKLRNSRSLFIEHKKRKIQFFNVFWNSILKLKIGWWRWHGLFERDWKCWNNSFPSEMNFPIRQNQIRFTNSTLTNK